MRQLTRAKGAPAPAQKHLIPEKLQLPGLEANIKLALSWSFNRAQPQTESLVFKRDYGNAHNTTTREARIKQVNAESSTQFSDLKFFNAQSMPERTSIEACNIISNLTGVQKGNPALSVHYLQKFINLCMKDGKKSKSYKIILNTLCRLSLSDISFGSKIKLQKTNGHFTNNIESGAPRKLLSVSKGSASFSLLMNAIDNVKPTIEVKKVRISGTTQLVPCIIPKKRQLSLAIRWIVEAAKVRRNTKKSMSLDQCFLAELVDASQNIGTVRKRRDDLHKLAESNRGFAHYRWW